MMSEAEGAMLAVGLVNLRLHNSVSNRGNADYENRPCQFARKWTMRVGLTISGSRT